MGDYSEYVGRGLRSVQGIANSIIAKRRYPGNALLAFMLVEGENDKKLYDGFIDTDRCQINIAYNKGNAIGVLAILEKENFPGILAVVDADFDVLENKLHNTHNLLYTDGHDAEMMMLASPALEKVLREFASQDKLASLMRNRNKDIRAIFIESTLPLGYLRWLSLRENLSFDFDDLDFAKFVNRDTLIVNVPKLIQTLQNRSRQNIGSSKRDILTDHDVQNKLDQFRSKTHNHWHVCCGHDFVCLLSIGLRKAIGSHSTRVVEPDQIEIALRLAFEHIHFRKTQLCLAIREWEKANKPFVILNVEFS